MVSIATLVPLLGMLQKFLGITLKEGLPEKFFQMVIDDPKLRGEFVGWADRRLNKNPFEQTMEEQLVALRVQNEAWRSLGMPTVSDADLDRLAKTAPAWPQGRDAYRSFRIRFGEGAEGVAMTFEAHAAAIQRVHAKYWRWDLLHSKSMPYQGKPVERLRLLNGNDTHHAVVEWIIISDLSANRQRKDITSVRESMSMADEGFIPSLTNH